jgi:tetratricopeptide (TPR) repeat protein
MALRPKKKQATAAPFQFLLASNWRFWLPRAALIVGLSFVIFWPALRGGFVWDDNWYLSENPLMQNVAGLWKFWFRPGTWVEYYPIQETVEWLEWHFWGADTLGYHLINVFLHILNALLVWRLLAKFGLRLAWLGGLLFAVHPAQVESVAWISELKNTLSLPFYLLAMCSWIDYEENGSKRDYQAALGLFFIGMLCKIALAPFPVIILLYAWWKRGRIAWSDFRDSAFFFAIALILGVLGVEAGSTYLELGNEPPEYIPMGPPFIRLAGTGLILAVYFSRALLPLKILVTYPQWKVEPHLIMGVLAWFVVAAVLFWFWKKRRTWGRHAMLGFGFFLLNLAPFLGFNPISYMTFTWVMDHFLYVPLIGLIGLVVAALGDLEGKLPAATGRGFAAAMAVAIVLLTWESHAFAGLYASEETLWGYVLQRNPNIWLAHHDLGCKLLDKGRDSEAIAEFKEVIRLNPSYSNAHYNMGIALDQLGKTAEAEDQYRQALAVNPRNAKAYVNLGGIAVRTGRFADAIDAYQQAVRLRPNDASNHYDLGSTLLRANQLPAAIEQLRTAVALDPDLSLAHENLGAALARSGDVSTAIDEFEAAIALNPSYVVARDNLGIALAQTGHVPDAIAQFQLALLTDPNDANASQALQKLQVIENDHPAQK